MESLVKVLEDYYVYVFRSENGDVLNEKHYILPPTPASDLLLGMDADGNYECVLNPY